MNPVPVFVVSAIDEDLLTATTLSMLGGRPGVLAVRYHHHRATGSLRRTVLGGGEPNIHTAAAASCCLSCTVRADLTAVLPTLVGTGCTAVIVCPPVAMDPVPVATAVRDVEHAGLHLAATVAAISPSALRTDLFGADLLAERDLALNASDRRAVGEILARQLETADVVALAEGSTRISAALLDHLVERERPRLPLSALPGAIGPLAAGRSAAVERAGLHAVAPTGAADVAGVWTVDLSTWKPFHPVRLLEVLETLGSGPLRGRGSFWLASRPAMRCAWDGAGGQLSVGVVEEWNCPAFTRLVITGTGRHAKRVRRAFDAALLADRELARGLQYWLPVDGDGWETWLGPCGEDAFSDFDAEH